jgi:hypothetical protein
MIAITESARKVRAALRAAFPKAKISVKSGHSEIEIEWEDTSPTVDELQTALKTARLAETGQHWNGTEYLTVDDHRLWFSCFNRAQREAAQRDFEQRQQEREAQSKREREAVEQAREAKRSKRTTRSLQRPEPPDPAVFEAFERLREKAEAQVVAHEGDRRPSWAPPLILGEELAMTCLELGWLTPDDKRIGRVWAMFATPKRSGRYAREHISTLPLHGIACRGFQFFAGAERQKTSELLFEAERRNDGTWRFGPSFYSPEYSSPRVRQWERLSSGSKQLSSGRIIPLGCPE